MSRRLTFTLREDEFAWLEKNVGDLHPVTAEGGWLASRLPLVGQRAIVRLVWALAAAERLDRPDPRGNQ